MLGPQTDAYIQNLEKEKGELQARLEDIRRNIIAIDSLIIKRRSQLLAGDEGKKVTLKNMDRLFFETLILDIISTTKNGVRTANIFKEIRKRGHKLNYNTLRAYIVSLRDNKKIVKNKKFVYNWILPDEDG